MVHNWCTQINRLLLSGKSNLNKNESDQIKVIAYARYKLFYKKKVIIRNKKPKIISCFKGCHTRMCCLRLANVEHSKKCT